MPSTPPAPPANAKTTTLQVGTYNALTDTFTVVYDLNDYVNTWLHTDSIKLTPAKKKAVRASNIRTDGELVVRWMRPNAHLTCDVYIRDTTPQACINRVHKLIAAIDEPPYVVRFALPGATSYTYFDVQLCDLQAPTDPVTVQGGVIKRISIDFEMEPGYRGDRQVLQNLAVNPGFEAPSGPAVTVFNDTFANANAYSLVAGGAPTVASNVMTIPAGGWVSFGSPTWSALANWQFRFQFLTGQQGFVYLHFVDANNWLLATWNGTTFFLQHDAAGSTTTLASVSWTPVNGTWYWFKVTQFPTVPGDAPYLSASLSADASGAPGAQLVAIAAPAVYQVTQVAFSGKPQIRAVGAALPIGGAFASVHRVDLFGPGGWVTLAGSGTGAASGAWDSAKGSPNYTPTHLAPLGLVNSANANAVQVPVTSFGAARIDLAPAGTADMSWTNYLGGTPAGSNAYPVAHGGDTLACTAAVASTGLSASAGVFLSISEYDSNGVFLTGGTVPGGLTGNTSWTPTGWTTLYGTYTTSASCAYVALRLRVLDSTTGSAGGTVWFDNAQVWDVTATGMANMPYCEMRFTQGPAQIMLSGIQGDAPARASIALGTYVASEASNSTFGFVLGKRKQVHQDTQLVNAIADNFSSHVAGVLDSSAYGGFYLQRSGTASDPSTYVTFTQAPIAVQGAFYFAMRAWTAETTPNLVKTGLSAFITISDAPWELVGNDLFSWQGLTTQAFTQSNTWVVTQAAASWSGPFLLPSMGMGAGALTDLSLNYSEIWAEYSDTTGGTLPAQRLNWGMLIPVDGGAMSGQIAASPALTTTWLWTYHDGLGLSLGKPVASTFGLEAAPIPNEAVSAGGQGTTPPAGGFAISSGGDSYLTLDPTTTIGGTPVNQFAGYITDQAGAVLPLYCEIVYSPVYLYAR